MNIYDGFKSEIDFFKNHPKYSKYLDTNKFGINSLGKYLSKVLVSKIKTILPDISNKIITSLDDVDKKLIPGRVVERLSFPFPYNYPCDFDNSNNYVSLQTNHHQ